jgi:hypothetical protein
MEFRRLGKNKEMRNGPAWWLDIMCLVQDILNRERMQGQVLQVVASLCQLGEREWSADARNGPAWWLDIMCPSVADMRELRKVRPRVSAPLPFP